VVKTEVLANMVHLSRLSQAQEKERLHQLSHLPKSAMLQRGRRVGGRKAGACRALSRRVKAGRAGDRRQQVCAAGEQGEQGVRSAGAQQAQRTCSCRRRSPCPRHCQST
jgi:hypothetical protein